MVNERLVVENMPLALKVASKWFNSFEGYYTREDIISESYLALVRASLVYNEDKGKFSPYAWYYIQSQLDGLYTKIKRMKENTISTEFVLSESKDGDSMRLIDILESKETYYEKFYDGEVEAITEAISKLNRRDQEILVAYYFEGIKKKDIAAMMGITPIWVSNLFKKAEKNLKALLGDKVCLIG